MRRFLKLRLIDLLEKGTSCQWINPKFT